MLDGTKLTNSSSLKISRADIQNARGRQVWALGNSVLYELCRAYPRHTRNDVIIAKILIIGRVYAAAIERRRPGTGRAGESRGDKFYTQTVVRAVKCSGIDTWLDGLRHLSLNDETAASILGVHAKVTALFSRISKLNKRSLAAKYLHFHRPDLFFLYDSRALSAIRAVAPALRHRRSGKNDSDYASFFRRCLWLRQQITREFGLQLNPRQLDDLLILVSERL